MLRTTLIAAVSAAVLGIAAPAAAQTVLTVSAEQTTTWVRNFNPFGQTSARFTTLSRMPSSSGPTNFGSRKSRWQYGASIRS